MFTCLVEPSLAPNDVQVIAETTNSVTIRWSISADEQNMENVIGFQIRINEITRKGGRRRRDIDTNTTIIEVNDKKTRSKMIQLSNDAELCMIEVAMYSDAGVGPFSKPVVVKVKKSYSTARTTERTMKSTSKATTDKSKRTKEIGPATTTTKTVSPAEPNSKQNMLHSSGSSELCVMSREIKCLHMYSEQKSH